MKGSAGTEQLKVSVQLKRNEHRIWQVSHENKITPATEKSGPHCSNANEGGLHSIHSRIGGKSIDPRSTNIEKELLLHPARSKLDQQKDANSPVLHHEDIRDREKTLIVLHHEDIRAREETLIVHPLKISWIHKVMLKAQCLDHPFQVILLVRGIKKVETEST